MKISLFDTVNDKRELRAYSLLGLEDQAEDLVRFITAEFCLLCFGRDPRDDHLWHEYGNQGRGICFGLDVKRKLLRNVTYVEKVKEVEFPAALLRDLLEHRPRSGGQPTRATNGPWPI